MRTTRLFGLNIIADSSANLLAQLEQQLATRTKRPCQLIYTPNPEQVVLAQQQPAFARILARADYLLPDGVGLVWAARLLRVFGKTKTTIPARIAGVELVAALLAAAHAQHLPVLIIGGRAYATERSPVSAWRYAAERSDAERSTVSAWRYTGSAKRYAADHPNLHWLEAFADKTRVTLSEEQALAEKILRLRPAIVFVALGAPEQEAWLAEHRQLLTQAGTKLGMAVGGSFDFIFGKVTRAPQLLQALGFEWLWRLCVQPWRWRRQLALLRFMGLLLREIRS